ncbi:MAG: hypothetical protein ACOCWG_03840 [bacterium]
MSSEHQNLFMKGTAAYSVKRYKEVTLTRLLQDLSRLDNKGLEDEVCNKIKNALNEAATLASSIPKESLFCVDFWQELSSFRDDYLVWNGISDNDNNPVSLRKQALKNLVVRRRKMWLPFRDKVKPIKNKDKKDKQLDLLSKLDKQLMDDMHFAFKDVIENHPDLFPSLRKEIIRFEKLSDS